jgi:hypothetical protein
MRSRLGVVKIIAALAGALGLSACATAFTGSPHVEGGRTGCQTKCNAQGMAVAGMVYMGEYSSACICEVPGAGHATLLQGATGATGGAAVAVEMMRRQQQQQYGGYRQY